MGLLDYAPSNGGLNATNYPNPYGLRAYRMLDGTYGGEMMPKYTGWLGVQPNANGGVSTELSASDDKGEFPLMVPTLTPAQLSLLLGLTDNQKVPRDIVNTASDFANVRRMQGLSPFKDIWDK